MMEQLHLYGLRNATKGIGLGQILALLRNRGQHRYGKKQQERGSPYQDAFGAIGTHRLTRVSLAKMQLKIWQIPAALDGRPTSPSLCLENTRFWWPRKGGSGLSVNGAKNRGRKMGTSALCGPNGNLLAINYPFSLSHFLGTSADGSALQNQ